MLNKEDILRDLAQNVYCRLKPSPIHGVGVFAIRDIPAGVNPFNGLNPELESYDIRIPINEILSSSTISDEVKKIVDDFYAKEKGDYIFPPFSLNEMPISFFTNHSSNPNISLQSDDNFITLREIKSGEELVSDYNSFSE